MFISDLGMDADRGVSESHGSDHGAEEDDRVAIAQVHRVTFGNKAWYPDIQTADNRVFFKIDKHDRELTKITLGKGINRQEQGWDQNTEQIAMVGRHACLEETSL